jgi:lariat debranching enzyme
MFRILKNAKPSYWFSAHMHVKYSAIYPHGLNYFTHFLSLDKCLGKRSCLQLLTFKTEDTKNIHEYQEKEG